jgi:hypothetical protein
MMQTDPEVVPAGAVGEIELSNHVRLRLKPVSPFVIHAVGERAIAKLPPGDSEQVKQMRDAAQEAAALDALLVLGVDIVDVPPELPGLDDSEWIEEMEAAGLGFDASNASSRRLHFLKYIIKTPEDLALIADGIMGQSGLAVSGVGPPALLNGHPPTQVDSPAPPRAARRAAKKAR